VIWKAVTTSMQGNVGPDSQKSPFVVLSAAVQRLLRFPAQKRRKKWAIQLVMGPCQLQEVAVDRKETQMYKSRRLTLQSPQTGSGEGGSGEALFHGLLQYMIGTGVPLTST
jgi:hypothetical protein